ncbi:MAG TPA: ABC transporter substrate-binding protein [Cycloclasticus sp.]|jgi:NitT/TauT family transport system substrate-binding protein|nr:ABC transporter substrate-binding protein [Cycloclasticus sp.]HIL91149.1 ABC transporter substrate-binding protein [Cycloclasticus sp.]
MILPDTFSTRARLIIPLIFTACLILSACTDVDNSSAIKISVLKYGTVNWTLETIKTSKLDIKNGFELSVQPLASTQASKIALQANATDIIVSDWTWVARQRGNSSDYVFAPYSSSAGSLVVPPGSSINSIRGLVGKKIGIAGGPLDKNWLLLRALALKEGVDLDKQVEKVFGAPPLLNNLILQGELDALINFWHYSARLKAKGYTQLLSTHDSIHKLGIKATIPILGYVFREAWANNHPIELNNFLTASREAAELLCTSDTHWNAILPLTRTNDAITQELLRHSYCEGRITQFTDGEKTAIQKIYSILASTGGAKLVGNVKQFDMQLFWNNPR